MSMLLVKHGVSFTCLPSVLSPAPHFVHKLLKQPGIDPSYLAYVLFVESVWDGRLRVCTHGLEVGEDGLFLEEAKRKNDTEPFKIVEEHVDQKVALTRIRDELLGGMEAIKMNAEEIFNLFDPEAKPTQEAIDQYLDDMYDLHIGPFKQYGPAGSVCATPHDSASYIGSSSSNMQSEANHTDFKAALVNRDAISNDLLSCTGLESEHQVQNGLLLCSRCYPAFGALQRYVDVVNGKLVVKVMNQTKNKNDPTYLERLGYLRAYRTEGSKYQRNAGKDVRNSDGEMELYSVQADPGLQPNLTALALHKTACLIWTMAGGANEDFDECCMDDDDEEQVGTTLRTSNWVESQG
ncbi:hypothetical protein BJ741DRAFT_689801 [Chytriomyces cf. hyalinus JEL632]|nr:hypothetical protein BJ741DRAFT_689801 [Chytriomyces cf. hyalinus JEL632]